MQLFCDMDGVLADFDLGYFRKFNQMPNKVSDNVDWNLVRTTPNFYRGLPPMIGMDDLWQYIRGFNPIVLTGVPHSIPEAPANKRAWIDKYLGKDIPMIACRSSEKCLHVKPGDILIDDWPKYRKLWIDAGGRWITHVNAETTILRLQDLGI